MTVFGPLLVTKITLPPRRALPRARLFALLDSGLHRRCAMVMAGAGFGKSTLVSQWLHEHVADVHVRAAWLSLDPADNDPQRFWNYVLGAIEHALPGSATEAAALLRGLQPAPAETVLTVLLNQLHAIEHPLVFVLDDYHLIAHPAIHDGLTFAIEHLPPHVHLVLISRSVPALPLHRWRARDQVIEIRAEHLRFTPEETRRFLVEGMRLSLTDEQVMTLDARTEGWAAGIQLAALTLRQQPDPAGFVTHFAASHRTALDYLVEEVFAHQPEYIQHFLLHTSLLERLSPALCDAVMGVLQPIGEPWSRILLDQIDQQNLFLIPLDEQQTWYRYHHLFAAALRQRLLRNAPELVPKLHRRAATWFADHQFHAEAIDHALHAQAYDVAADLIENAAGPTAQRGETATVQRWLDALPPQVRTNRIDLLLWNAWLALMRPDWTALVQHVVEAEQVINAVEPPDSPRRGEVFALKARLARVHGNAAESYDLSRQALNFLRPTDVFSRGMVSGTAALAAWELGDLAAAEQYIGEAVAYSNAVTDVPLISLSQAMQACIWLDQGRLRQAERTCRDALRTADTRGLTHSPMNAYSLNVLAEVALLRNELDDAQLHAAAARKLLGVEVFKDAVIRALEVELGVAHMKGSAAHVAEVFAELEHAVPAANIPVLDTLLILQQAWLALLSNQVTEAETLLEPWNNSHSVDRTTPGTVSTALALLRIKQGRAAEALELLTEPPRVGMLAGTRVALLAAPLHAVALDAQGQSAAADAVLVQALERAAPENLIHPFLDLGSLLAPLLSRVVQTLPHEHRSFLFAVRIHHAITTSMAATPALITQRSVVAPTHDLVEPLSDREVEVLHLLAQGMTNQHIAERLIITERTAKKHVTNILGKLGATNRTHAVALARNAGLLS